MGSQDDRATNIILTVMEKREECYRQEILKFLKKKKERKKEKLKPCRPKKAVYLGSR